MVNRTDQEKRSSNVRAGLLILVQLGHQEVRDLLNLVDACSGRCTRSDIHNGIKAW